MNDELAEDWRKDIKHMTNGNETSEYLFLCLTDVEVTARDDSRVLLHTPKFSVTIAKKDLRLVRGSFFEWLALAHRVCDGIGAQAGSLDKILHQSPGRTFVPEEYIPISPGSGVRHNASGATGIIIESCVWDDDVRILWMDGSITEVDKDVLELTSKDVANPLFTVLPRLLTAEDRE